MPEPSAADFIDYALREVEQRIDGVDESVRDDLRASLRVARKLALPVGATGEDQPAQPAQPVAPAAAGAAPPTPGLAGPQAGQAAAAPAAEAPAGEGFPAPPAG